MYGSIEVNMVYKQIVWSTEIVLQDSSRYEYGIYGME